jgi:hypothetical protein
MMSFATRGSCSDLSFKDTTWDGWLRKLFVVFDYSKNKYSKGLVMYGYKVRLAELRALSSLLTSMASTVNGEIRELESNNEDDVFASNWGNAKTGLVAVHAFVRQIAGATASSRMDAEYEEFKPKKKASKKKGVNHGQP